jgi:hypothetical protein
VCRIRCYPCRTSGTGSTKRGDSGHSGELAQPGRPAAVAADPVADRLPALSMHVQLVVDERDGGSGVGVGRRERDSDPVLTARLPADDGVTVG